MPIDRQEILTKLHQLPSLPLLLQEIIASFSDPNLDTTLLAQKISRDQGLSAKILRVANSSFYGLSRKVGSIPDAIVVLGFDTVRSLALSAGMVNAFPPAVGGAFDRNAYWQRSFHVATLSKALAHNLGHMQQVAFTSGMFYDIGLLVLDLCIPQQFAKLLQQHCTSGLDLIELERSELGFDHADIGAELLRLWNFPEEIELLVRHWRTAEPHPSFNPLMCIVHAAALLESGASPDELFAKLSKIWGSRIPVTRESIEACLPAQVAPPDATYPWGD